MVGSRKVAERATIILRSCYVYSNLEARIAAYAPKLLSSEPANHMQTLTESVFRLAPPGGLFDETAVRNLFPDVSPGARRVLVHRAFQQGEILRLKRGLYCLAPPYRKTDIHPFAIAATLHSPSHISLESALSYHGLIPEVVHEVTSVTTARSRAFETPLGRFSFWRVPANDPRAGVRAVQLDEHGWAFLALPVRAIADLVYLRKGITWARDGLDFLTESLRIDVDELREISAGDFAAVAQSLRNRRTRDYLAGLHKAIRS